MNPPPAAHDPDSFDELLNDLNTLPRTRPDLAESIFAQTRGVLSQRRWLRRGGLTLAFLACYAVGIGSGWLLKPDAARQIAGQAEPSAAGHVVPADSLATSTNRHPSTPLQPQSISNPRKTSPRAVVTKTAGAKAGRSQFENFRRAGDRMLFERANIRSAMDCYRRALSHASDQELRVEIERDSWLLMSLKQSRLEERKHVRQKRV